MYERKCQTREIRKREYQIHCPICGKFQYRIREGETSFQCEKCRTYTVAIVKDGRLTMYEEDASLHEADWREQRKVARNVSFA